MSEMKKISTLFWALTAGVAVSLAASVYFVIQRHQDLKAQESNPAEVAVPAGTTPHIAATPSAVATPNP